MKEEEHRLYGRPCLLVQLYADGSVCFQAFTEMNKSAFARENMVIQQIRNATLKIEFGKITFLIDPWFQDQGTGFSAKAVRPEMQGITAIK